VTTASALAAGSAVEIILDASGSMLQRLGGQRRIDIAKQTLTRLTSATIPAGTPFALHVFGRELDSCQTDQALSQAMRSGFEIVNVQGQAVAEGLAGGEPVRVMPGNYNMRIKGQPNRAQPVTVRPKETEAVRF
jgi:hypothetical protein